MDNLLQHRIYRYQFETAALINAYPPQFLNENKQIVHRISCPPGCHYQGELAVSRWFAMSLPQTFSPLENQIDLDVRPNHFGYEPSPHPDQVEWYLNFAHQDLFCAYHSSLFAQDEMQVAEHPALGSVREALLARGISTFTVEKNEPTPILIRGVERRCAIATDPNPEQGRPYGLYGNQFSRAKPEAIQQATRPLNPPTITNIIAMEAPAGGYGSYKIQEIEYILITALTGFSAAYLESQSASNQQPRVIIHTGFWGCGAYGGNRILMGILQLLAARLSPVNQLVFHTGDAIGSQTLAKAEQILNRLLDSDHLDVQVSTLIEQLYQINFQWGVTDGN